MDQTLSFVNIKAGERYAFLEGILVLYRYSPVTMLSVFTPPLLGALTFDASPVSSIRGEHQGSWLRSRLGLLNL